MKQPLEKEKQMAGRKSALYKVGDYRTAQGIETEIIEQHREWRQR